MSGRKAEILRVAYDMVGTKGLESLHARTVAAELGVNHATVHYYFRSRVDLLVGLAGYAREQLRRDRQRYWEGTTHAGEALESELSLAEAYSKTSSRFVRVLAALLTASSAHPVLKDEVRSLYELWAEGVAAQLGSALAAKQVLETPIADGQLLASVLLGVCLASHLTDGQVDASAMMDRVFETLFGS
jgi:AcrR family transcriptional regulator